MLRGMSLLFARAQGTVYLGSFQPSLLNRAYAPPEAHFHDAFNDEYVYRGQVITDHIPGALAIQAAFESADLASLDAGGSL